MIQKVIEAIESKLGEFILQHVDTENPQYIIWVDKQDLKKIISFLNSDPDCYFDYLSTITAIDNTEAEGIFELSYHLKSLPLAHEFILKTSINTASGESLTEEVPSVCDIFKTANWHEREIYDLFGIPFSGHPDLRRILMPNDWKGYPLRKDYKTDEKYHGVKIDFEQN